MRMRVGGDGSVQSGNWLQRCVRNKLFFFFGSYSAALIYCPPMWTWWEQLTVRGLELQQIWMRQSGRCRLCKLYFLQPEKNPRASDKLCYDRTSRHGLLPISRYEAYALNPAHTDFTWKSKPGRKPQCWEQKWQGFESYRILEKQIIIVTKT